MKTQLPEGAELAIDRAYKGFRIRAWWGFGVDAIVLIERHGSDLREFVYPAYKIFNLDAHFEDIVEGEIDQDDRGYLIAGSDGIGGCIVPHPVTESLTGSLTAKSETTEKADDK